jgi:hypothetical protein
MSLERGALSLVRIIEELLEWRSSGSGLENLASCGRSVGIVRLRTQATEFVVVAESANKYAIFKYVK